ncbi:MAG: IS30 family transposase [Burkholderia sp.]
MISIANTTADAAVTSFGMILNRIDAQRRLSMTYDQGREMARHEQLCETTDIKVYFADPHSPWQRWRNEDPNGLLRQDMPKGTDLAVFSQAEFDDIAWQMNIHPRKSLGWTCPVNCSYPNRSMFVSIIMTSLPWGMPFGHNWLLLHFNPETVTR